MKLFKNCFYLIIVANIVNFSSCAYFNTFYNAKQYFADAEKIRLEKEGDIVPVAAIDKYTKTIQKCKKSLEEYPDSKWKIETYLLMGKATFYKNDFDTALDYLKIVLNQGNESQIIEGQYWQALCKWRKGSSKTATDELNRLISLGAKDRIKAKCHLSLSDIALEESKTELALAHLEDGAKITKDRIQRGVIYAKLAELAYQKENYDVAFSAYSQVISNSLAKEKIEHAHLQILKIHRINQKYRSASKKIKSMLSDDKFKNISGNLEIELSKLYIQQGDINEAITRLETITNDRRKSLISAEAFYILGDLHLTKRWDPNKAKEYFTQVVKEFSKSPFKAKSISKTNSISSYLKTKDELTSINETTRSDSLVSSGLIINDSLTISNKDSVSNLDRAEIIYKLADLEFFTFNRFDQGVSLFNQVIDEHENSSYRPKSLFTLSLIHRNLKDTLRSKRLENMLIKEYPKSDFAAYLNSDLNELKGPEFRTFKEAENIWDTNPNSSIDSLRKIISTYPKTELSIYAAYFLGFKYDESAEIDSAIKYYSWIQSNHPESEQARELYNRLISLKEILTFISGHSDSSASINKVN
tara:strand:+ start:23508 stop:25265 length:1758 start_codon:yes stop_codon:yes gene_type:complete